MTGASQRLDAAAVLDALVRAVVVTRLDGVVDAWNRQAAALYGWAPEEAVGRPLAELLQTVAPAPAMMRLVELAAAGGSWAGDLTVIGRQRDPVRAWGSIRPALEADGTPAMVVFASEDVTDRRLLEQTSADLTERLRLALEAGELGTFHWDMATGVVEWDAKLEQLYGVAPGSFPGTFEAWLALVHPDDVAAARATLDEAVRTRDRYTVQHRVTLHDGSTRWIRGEGQVTLGPDGEVTGTIGCARDATAEVEAQRERTRATDEALRAAEQERLHRERLEFLAVINDALAASRSRQEVMHNVTHAAVPRLGDWCTLHLLSDGSPIPEVETAHADPAMVDMARQLQERFPFDPDSPTGVAMVLRTATSEFFPVIDDAVLSDLHVEDGARQVVHDLALSSAMTVPLVKRGRVVGALQFVMSHSRRHYTVDDLTLAEAVAARIASSLENLRLSEEQRAIATTLQASLLPAAMPEVPGLEIAVRYWANGEGVEVGGDFYDLFPIDDDHWGVVIGDVCGTGPNAAAVTGLARHSIAAAAWHGDDHATVLRSLNRSMLTRGAGPFCTAIYGTLEPHAGGCTFTFAVGGHPLPVVVDPDGRAATAGSPGTLIGVLEEIEVTPTTLDLSPGTLVVLYTDGATDAPPPHDLDADELSATVARAAAVSSTADELADALHRELSRGLPLEARNDDIALLILKVSG